MGRGIELDQMNIVHLNLEGPFMDNSGYQETLLAKSHKMMCNNVTIINNNHVLHGDGTITRCEAGEYYNNDQVKIVRMNLYDSKDRRHIDVRGLYRLLVKERPDFIMNHGLFIFEVLAIAKYKKKVNKNCIVVADSHATKDNANIMLNNPKNFLFRILVKMVNRYMAQYYKKIYGIVEDAVELMVDYAGIPREKTAVLELGYDETLIDFAHQSEIKNFIRKKYDIPQDAFLLVHGGKLDEGKRTRELISIIDCLPSSIHVIVFGKFIDEGYKESVFQLAEQGKERVHFAGELKQKDIYELYLASDAAVFPGTPSCLRQQAVATGLPIIIGFNKADEGINIAMNGNAVCLNEGWTSEDLIEAINMVYNDLSYRQKAVELSKNEYRKYSYLYQAEALIVNNV